MLNLGFTLRGARMGRVRSIHRLHLLALCLPLALSPFSVSAALSPPTLSPSSGAFTNLVAITLTAPPAGASNMLSFNGGTTWTAQNGTLLLDGYGQGVANILARTQSGSSQSANAAYGPYQFVAANTGVSPAWASDHSSVAVTLTNATTNAVLAWQKSGGAITTNAAFSANTPRSVTLYGFKAGYLSSTNTWVLQQTAPPTIAPQNLALSLSNLNSTITVSPAQPGSVVNVRSDAVFCAPPAAENAAATIWWNVDALDPLYWHTNTGTWRSYVAPVAAYSGPAAASTFGNGPCAIYTNLLLAANAYQSNQLASAPVFGFYPLAPAAPVISPNGGSFGGPVPATLSFPLAEQFGYSPDGGANWILSYYSGVSMGNPASADLNWYNSGSFFFEGPQGYPVKDWPHFPGTVEYSYGPSGLVIWTIDVGPGAIDSAAYAGWDGSTRLDLPLIQPTDGASQVSVLASGFNAFWQTNQPLAANGYGSEPTGGTGPWPAPTLTQSAPFSFQLPVFTVTPSWSADHTSLTLSALQSPAGANLHYTLDGSAPAVSSPLLAQGNLTNWMTSELVLTQPGAVRLSEIGYDVGGLTTTYGTATYAVADRGLNFAGYTAQTWSNAWAATAPITFTPPPARYYTPTNTALSCATPGAIIFLQVSPDPGNDTNLVGVSGSGMGVNGTYYWSAGQYTNELNGSISVGHVGTNTNVWSLSWAGLGVLYTSSNLYGSAWVTTTNGVNPPPATTATVGWHRYTSPVSIKTNTVIEAYAYTPTTFASATTNAGFAFGNPNPLPVSFQFLNGTTFRFSWATNAGVVNVLFSTNLTGPWTNIYSGTGIISGTNGVRDFTLTPPRGFYRFSH